MLANKTGGKVTDEATISEYLFRVTLPSQLSPLARRSALLQIKIHRGNSTQLNFS